jgi:polymorphic toxin system nucleotidyltransferase-like protein
MNMPAEKLRTLDAITEALRNVPNVVAVVLGGSYACGLARADSDIDIGLYYREASPFSVEQVRSVAERICTAGSVPVITEMYGWGPWVNGGAWIQTPVGKVDFVYRNLNQVQIVIEEGRHGVWRHDYDQQPPYGFRSVVYFGETLICVPLHDPEAEIVRLKKSVAEYPEPLRERIVQESLWGAEFSLRIGRTFANSADVYNAAGCMTRVAQFLVHALFALNEEYFVSDKYASRLIEQFALRPREFTPRLERVLSNPGDDPTELRRSTELLTALWLETVELTAGTYKPRFDLKVVLP